MNLTLQVVDAIGNIRAEKSGINEVSLIHDLVYEPGTRLIFTTDQTEEHIVFSLDQGLPATLAYFRGQFFEFPVPFGDDKASYPPSAFIGARSRMFARRARRDEIDYRRNLAVNPWDFSKAAHVYPHALANVETRREAVFAARNAIDGEMANDDHGVWPFTSWGINQDPNAALTVHFGRLVEVDEVVLRLRADFPHDAWWENAKLAFSDGSHLALELKKTGTNQTFAFPARKIEWVHLSNLIKANDPSPFPALTQIEVWGRDLAGLDSAMQTRPGYLQAPIVRTKALPET